MRPSAGLDLRRWARRPGFDSRSALFRLTGPVCLRSFLN
jgi:hypothetical protein